MRNDINRLRELKRKVSKELNKGKEISESGPSLADYTEDEKCMNSRVFKRAIRDKANIDVWADTWLETLPANAFAKRKAIEALRKLYKESDGLKVYCSRMWLAEKADVSERAISYLMVEGVEKGFLVLNQRKAYVPNNPKYKTAKWFFVPCLPMEYKENLSKKKTQETRGEQRTQDVEKFGGDFADTRVACVTSNLVSSVSCTLHYVQRTSSRIRYNKLYLITLRNLKAKYLSGRINRFLTETCQRSNFKINARNINPLLRNTLQSFQVFSPELTSSKSLAPDFSSTKAFALKCPDLKNIESFPFAERASTHTFAFAFSNSNIPTLSRAVRFQNIGCLDIGGTGSGNSGAHQNKKTGERFDVSGSSRRMADVRKLSLGCLPSPELSRLQRRHSKGSGPMNAGESGSRKVNRIPLTLALNHWSPKFFKGSAPISESQRRRDCPVPNLVQMHITAPALPKNQFWREV